MVKYVLTLEYEREKKMKRMFKLKENKKPAIFHLEETV